MENVKVIDTENSHGQTIVYYSYSLNGRQYETNVNFNPQEVTLDTVLKKIGVRMEVETETTDIPDEVESLENTSISDKLQVLELDKVSEVANMDTKTDEVVDG